MKKIRFRKYIVLILFMIAAAENAYAAETAEPVNSEGKKKFSVDAI